jgi:XRE family transcriptional regulator, regulator of sulfur utilization
MKITARDVKIALLAVAATLCVVAFAQPTEVLHSTVFDWNAMVAKPTNVGSVRSIFRGPTPTLEELEMHVTTLNPGQTSHAPHKHPNEELVIIKEGTVETLSHGKWVKAGPGSIIFNASNELHGLKNVGTTPATYHVINWKTDKTPASPSAQ